MSTLPEISPEHRAGYVAIVGQPNVGKSTFLNAVMGTKLSIVSPKPQTTRTAVRGFWNTPKAQVIFIDTPGWLSPRDSYQSQMKKSIDISIREDADSVIWIVEPRLPSEADKTFGALLVKAAHPNHLVINKIDTQKDQAVLESIRDQYRAAFPTFISIDFISAKKNEGLRPLLESIACELPLSPPYFPKDQLTDHWERFYVAELIREQIFMLFQDEVPHAAYVHIEQFVEKEGRKDTIKVSILVETEGQKRIVIGRNGQMIRTLGQKSREEIERRIGRPVFLELKVKVQKNWRKDDHFLSKLSLANTY